MTTKAKPTLWDTIWNRAAIAAAFLDSLNIGAIFAAFLHELTHKLLENTAKYFMFPIAAAFSFLLAIKAVRDAYKDPTKGKVFNATVEIIAAIAISVAVVGALAGIAAFHLATPILFAVITGGKSLINAALACGYLGASFVTDDKEKAKNYRSIARDHAIGSVATLLISAAVIGVMILLKPVIAPLGVIAGLIGTAMAIKMAFVDTQAKKAKSEENHSLIEEAANEEQQHEQPHDLKADLTLSNGKISNPPPIVSLEEETKAVATSDIQLSQSENRERNAKQSSSPRKSVIPQPKVKLSQASKLFVLPSGKEDNATIVNQSPTSLRHRPGKTGSGE